MGYCADLRRAAQEGKGVLRFDTAGWAGVEVRVFVLAAQEHHADIEVAFERSSSSHGKRDGHAADQVFAAELIAFT